VQLNSAARLLDEAQRVMRKVRYCWVGTTGSRDANLRVVEPFWPAVEQPWTLSFLTSRSSRKTAEIAATPRLSLGFQYDPEFAYVTLVGEGAILDERALVQKHWRDSWLRFFPAGPADPDAILIEVRADRVEIWNPVREIAPEPYGLRVSVVERDGDHGWRVLA
jgi:general stress protein 26